LFSPGSLPANLVIIPLSSLVIWIGSASLLAGLLGLLPLSAGCNLLAALIMVAMDWLLQHGTALPATWFTASFRVPWLTPASLVFMTAIFLAGSAVHWSPRYGGFWPPAIAVALLVIFGVKFG
jgi:competence protein ComEC